MEKLSLVLFAGLGGFIGTSLRYLANIAVAKIYTTDFPLATFLVNILGAFILGVITELTNKYVVMKPELFVFLTVGLCGGFTTFSTLIYESYHIMKEDLILKTVLYGAISYIVGFLFLYSGILLVRFLFSKVG